MSTNTVQTIEKSDAVDVSKETLNEYAYLDRNEFTSEKFKLKVLQLPKFYGIGELKKLLNVTLKLGSNKIKAPRKGSQWVYICFRSEDDRNKATETLNGYVWKGKQLKVEDAKPAPDPLVKKRKEIIDGAQNVEKRTKIENCSQEERLKDSTIPYWNVPYDEQLRLKQSEVRKLLMKLGNELWKGNPLLRKIIEKQRKENEGLPCELWEIRSADRQDGYRTKCEFTVGMDEETKLPTVGFRLGSYVTGFTGVAAVDGLVHVPDRMKKAAKIFQSFVQSSPLKVFNAENQTGHFKQLTARWSMAYDELMLIVGVQIKELDESAVTQLKNDLKDFFTIGDGKEANVNSLYFQTVQKRKSGEKSPKPEHLWGTTHIYETILGLKFRVSPEAFFQVNTQAAEILYSSAIELADPTDDTTVVDICCGTGTIGLCFSKHCSQVLGLEYISEAVEDAKVNARDNGIENTQFFAGRAEDILSSVMNRASGSETIAIVDPPRAGLHQKALIQLRQNKNLNKLVYLSCDPSAAMKNFVDLGRPTSKTMHNDPLIPIRAVAVDMFPYTKHCELMIYFERFKYDTPEQQVSAQEIEIESKINQNIECFDSNNKQENMDVKPK